MLAASLTFISALFEATRCGALSWRMRSDDDRDLFEASVADELVTVEILYLPGTSGSERAFVRVIGLNAWEVFARGSDGYDVVMRMLALNIPGWSDGQAGYEKALERATARIRALGSSS